MKRAVLILLAMALLAAAACGLADGDVISYLAYDAPLPPLGVEGQLEVHFINVASADCILLRCGSETMLVDSGVLRNYERITAYLRTIGVDRLDYAFGTHPHDDHIGGFIGVLEEVPVGAYLQPRLYEKYESKIQTQLFRVIEGKGIETRMVDNDAVMYLGTAKLTFMQWQNPSAAQNNRSMVLKVEYGERAVLLTADIESLGQKAITGVYGDRLRADIVKMPHHGLTPYTKELHEAAQPSLATFSNVRDKIYDVLRTCEKRGVTWMLVTKGTLVAVTDGAAWRVWQIPRE